MNIIESLNDRLWSTSPTRGGDNSSRFALDRIDTTNTSELNDMLEEPLVVPFIPPSELGLSPAAGSTVVVFAC